MASGVHIPFFIDQFDIDILHPVPSIGRPLRTGTIQSTHTDRAIGLFLYFLCYRPFYSVRRV